MSRFHLGQKVLITGPFATKYRGCKATVIGVRQHVTVLDKYIVRLEEGDDAELFEIQLVAVKERKNRA